MTTSIGDPVARNGVWFGTHIANTPLPNALSVSDWNGRIPLLANELAAVQGDCRLLFVGDSVVDFWRTMGLEVFNAFYANRRPLNQGINGDRTQNVLYRLAGLGLMKGIAPRLAVVHIGSNNAFFGDDPATVVDGLKAVVELIRQLSPATKVLVEKLFPRDTPGSAVRTTNDTINALLEADTGFFDAIHVGLHDIGNAFFVPSTQEIDRVLMPDLAHPSKAGYQIWANAIEPIVAAIVDV